MRYVVIGLLVGLCGCLGGSSPGEDAGVADAGSSDAGPACQITTTGLPTDHCGNAWKCGADTYMVDCSPSPDGGSLRSCTCFRNSVSGATFSSYTYCASGNTDAMAAANQACSWSVR